MLKKFNPFDSSSSDNSGLEGSLAEKDKMNSTAAFNPFSDEESIAEVRNVIEKKQIKCDHCDKIFSNKHNTKLHLIRDDFHQRNVFNFQMSPF